MRSMDKITVSIQALQSPDCFRSRHVRFQQIARWLLHFFFASSFSHFNRYSPAHEKFVSIRYLLPLGFLLSTPSVRYPLKSLNRSSASIIWVLTRSDHQTKFSFHSHLLHYFFYALQQMNLLSLLAFFILYARNNDSSSDEYSFPFGPVSQSV